MDKKSEAVGNNMIIKDIQTYIVSQELGSSKFAYSQNWYSTRTIMLLKIITDEGIEGWGECFGPAYAHKAIIENYYKPYLLGVNPLDREKIWDDLYNLFRDHGQFGLSIESLSGIDLALWDIAGKIFNQPVWQLLGGKRRETITPYATGLYLREEGNPLIYMPKEAVSYIEQGFKGLKMKVGFGIDNDIANIKAVREAIGEEPFLAIDANHAYDVPTAIKLAWAVEEYNIAWFEEPVVPEDIEGYKKVREASSIPISGGEAHFTRWGFNRLLSNGCVDIAQPDACVTGGISEVMKIAGLCSVNGIRMIPHVWGSAIALHAAINICFAIPDMPPSLFPEDMLLEYDRTPNIFREQLAGSPLNVNEGLVYPTNTAGLGLLVDENLIKKYSIG